MTVEDLKAYGADTAQGLERCMGMESMYLRLVGMIPGDANFGKLEEALEAGDLKAGFEAAHALKGAAANLALTPLLTPVSEITELLRAGTQTDYAPLLEKIRTAREGLERLCVQG